MYVGRWLACLYCHRQCHSVTLADMAWHQCADVWHTCPSNVSSPPSAGIIHNDVHHCTLLGKAQTTHKPTGADAVIT
jgi:hypothetical protein